MNQETYQKGKTTPQVKLIMKQQRKKRQMYRRRRQVAFILFVLLIASFIYAINLLFGQVIKSEALEPTPEEKAKVTEVQKEKKVEIKEISTKVASKTTVKMEKVVTEKVETTPVDVTPVEPEPVKQSIYNPNIPMPKEHQEYLYELCQERGLDYKKTLAVIKHESVFDQNATNATNDYGYFQVNAINHTDLAQKLDTENSPLNPYINMNWGTYMLSNLYAYWGERGLSGERLDESVWSSYNKGINGFKKYGHATEYIYKMNEAIQFINSAF